MTVDWTNIDKNDPAARRRAVLTDMAEQHKRKPIVDANGTPVRYDDQSPTYRSVVTREAHEAAHGTGERTRHSVYDQPFGLR